MKETTSERLKKIMKDRDLKQVDILKMCEPFCKQYNVKLNKNHLSQYVSGKVEPRQQTLSILGMALNVSEAWLMGYFVPMERTSATDAKVKSSNDIITPQVRSLLKSYHSLNKIGKEEAEKRVEELTHIRKYVENYMLPVAAHNDHPLTDEEIRLMNKDLEGE